MSKTKLIIPSLFLLLLAGCDQADKPPPEVKLNPSATSIEYNGTFTMSWEATRVDYCIASGDWKGNIKRSGSETLGPLTRDSFYLLDCFKRGEQISNSVSIKVGEPQIPKISLSAHPLSLEYGGTSTISWTSEHVENCTAEGDWTGPLALNGSLRLEELTSDSEFRLYCTGPQGEVSDNISIDVYEPGIVVPQVSLTASPASIPFNGSTTLSWNTEGADICRASGDWFGSRDRSGSQGVRQLTQDSRFILTCTIAGGGGGRGIDIVEVKVDPPPAPEVSLTANHSEVTPNSSVTLRWSSSHADSCIGTGDWTGTKRFSGTQTIPSVEENSEFTLQCIGVGGLGTDTVNISVTDNNQ